MKKKGKVGAQKGSSPLQGSWTATIDRHAVKQASTIVGVCGGGKVNHRKQEKNEGGQNL